MKFIARPIEVDAFKIESVEGSSPAGTTLLLEELGYQIATPEMTARMQPGVGDYWVIQPDGYVYLNPKEVFERKYAPADAAAERAGALSSPTA